MIRWRGNPSVFPSVVCLRTCMCRRVCVFDHIPEYVLCQCRQWVGTFSVFMCGYCVWPWWSLYSRHVVYSGLSESLLPACVVYLCSLWEVRLTPHSWPNPELTRLDPIWPHLQKYTRDNRMKPKQGKQSSLLQITNIRDKIFLTDQNNVPSVFAVIYLWPISEVSPW